MSYGKHAIDCLRSDLGFWREVKDKWVIVYQPLRPTGEPMYLKLYPDGETSSMTKDQGGPGWAAGCITNCTLFGTYEEACAAAALAPYLGTLDKTMKRIVQITIDVKVNVELLEDRPIDVLDALAEI